MIQPAELFREKWDAELARRGKESPSYEVGDYIATGKERAPYGKRTAAWWTEVGGPTMLQKYIDWRKATRWDLWEIDGKPAIEVPINFDLPGDIRVKGFIDRLFVTPTGELVVVDLKTGRTPETPEQLGLYACAVHAQYGVRPTWGFWWDAKPGTHSQPLLLDSYTPEYIAATYADAIRGMNAGSFPAKPANNCRTWCGVRDFCAAVGGSKAQGVDPLLANQS